MDYCESNKHMGQVCVLKISMNPCKLQGRPAGSQGGLDKSRLYQNCQEGGKVKNACG